jgi:two-component system capsular synthesis response regulator RcsB
LKWSIMAPLRVAVLDDHYLIQMALELRLSREADMKVVGVYANSRDLLASLSETPADLLILDYALGASELDGLHLIGLIRRRFPTLCILISSSTETPSVVNLSLSVGANGFFGKSESAELLVEAIRKVASGETYVSPGLAYRLGRQPTAGRSMPDVKGAQRLLNDPTLSPKEREVLRCCLDGMSVSQISRKFMRSMKTISGQKQAAFRKLGVRTDAELFKLQHSLATN